MAKKVVGFFISKLISIKFFFSKSHQINRDLTDLIIFPEMTCHDTFRRSQTLIFFIKMTLAQNQHFREL